MRTLIWLVTTAVACVPDPSIEGADPAERAGTTVPEDADAAQPASEGDTDEEEPPPSCDERYDRCLEDGREPETCELHRQDCLAASTPA